MADSIEILKHIKVDLYGDVKRFAVSAKQNDLSSRYVAVTLLKDGVEYSIPDDVDLVAAVTKADQKSVWNDCTRSGNEVLIELTRQMLASQGSALCDVELYQEGAVLTSASFEIMVFPSQRKDESIISSGEYSRLENTIFAARSVLETSQELEKEVDDAEAERVSNENVRIENEKNRITQYNKSVVVTKECEQAVESSRKLESDLTGIDGVVNAVKDYYQKLIEIKSDIDINIDGGTPTSNEMYLIDGGSPTSVETNEYSAGDPFTL